MKMTKLLAGGVAATVAVTSLASVVSAETKVFDMSKAKAEYSDSAVMAGDINKTIGASIKQSTMQKVVLDLGLNNDWKTGTWQGAWGTPTLKVTGTKLSDADKVERVTKEYTFTLTDNHTATIVVLNDEEPVYRAGEFAPCYFDTIESMELSGFGYSGSTTDKATYDKWSNGISIDVGDATVAGKDVYSNDIAKNKKLLEAATDNKAAALVAYAFTNGGYRVSTDSFMEYSISKDKLSITKVYPELAVTTDAANNTLWRHDLQLLSYADAHKADTNSGKQDNDQTYADDDVTKGTNPKEFAGLASQVADFFNKQTNGTITFKVTIPAASGSTSGWFENGVPSTQVGVQNALLGVTSNDFALAFNYDQTGSLLAITSVDAASNTITFDISDVLDALGGQTVGVIDNIYYGLTKNALTDLGKGKITVEEITLAYEEDADVEADIEDDDAAVEEDDDATVEEDDDVAIEDDDTATEDDDTDGEVAGDVIDTPVVEDDDANPGTGVALAVVPAMVAAAAVVLSKKRK